MQHYPLKLLHMGFERALTASVNLIKFYEYRALGSPVISTDFGEMVLRGDEEDTFISRGVPDVNRLVQNALRYSAGADPLRQFAAGNSWEARFADAEII